ncbi:tRNA (N6-isopentenyl adenosine(37)-C2)-methylthiotransferase MiaB [Candidatus Riesia pediculicola]|uniref:tRNA (N6-isopentenyl adenosine(37)-C2)-methylthiotransferase MiaB n=1 Tax=Candidatus Riesia pediculicola TaxID=401619 RepID=UPI0009B7A24D|nr:tRNA (N6-isopentenyl adenosine(37)-C2)-methylthiotransferase MiaB [Candidatus Riesia pediculicola]ARC53615.1 (dimethylallyl)adenosine tRNA methylthiotransferase [Candidatus Riesia pediculicola]QOJ86267.1 tRNA (N6-isopentenyl adenosine(37)-C2)-methylthiotransferase MiaB [Candidatus Riesia pediculicola]
MKTYYKKIYIKTWGCDMNKYDSSKIIDIFFKKKKYSLAKTDTEADIILLNTCSVREKAQEKVFHQLGRWKKLKKNKIELILCVGGCVASQMNKSILKRAPYVDIIFGPKTIHLLPEMIRSFEKSRRKIINIDSNFRNKKFQKNHETIRKDISSLISIIEGCNKKCSFCIVPFTRGKEFSRPLNEILIEIKNLVSEGCREIHLLGQNVNAYRYVQKNGKIYDFSKLIQKISLINGVKRIKFSTNHPNHFTQDVIDLYSTISQLVDYVHIPVQSGSDEILRKMRRPYTIERYKKIIKKIREVRPDILIGSDFIVGFPGETKEDFLKTIQLVKEIDFDVSFSFMYSSRPGTEASLLRDDTNGHEKRNRLYFLQNLIERQIIEHNKRMVNQTQKILVLSKDQNDPNKLVGFSNKNRKVIFYGSKEMIGNLIDVKITHFYKNKLYGRAIE